MQIRLHSVYLVFFLLLLLTSCTYSSKIVSLEGEWEWREGFNTSWLMEGRSPEWKKTNLPAHLVDIIGNKDFKGRITLRKKLPASIIHQLKLNKNIQFRSGRLSKAADFYFNAGLIGSLGPGDPSKIETGSEFTGTLTYENINDNNGDMLYIVLLIPGNNQMRALIGKNIEVGDNQQIYSHIYSDILITFILIFTHLLIGSYFIHIGIRINAKSFYIYFGTYCIILSGFYFIYYPGHQLLIFIDTTLRYSLMHAMLVSTGPFFILFIYALYKKKLTLILKIWIGFCSVIIISLFFLKPEIIDLIINIWYVVWIGILAYICYMVTRQLIKNNVEAILIITGLSIMILGIIQDILSNEGFINTTPAGIYTSILSISFFSISIINRFILTYKKVEKLNVELEIRMEERTKRLKEAQVKLIDTAHKAGMAEVATSILHNMRNILNSMSISCEEIMETLEDSKIEGLVKANNLLQEHRSNIHAFLTEDPKGKLLITYYNNIVTYLNEEQSKIMTEIVQIKKNLSMVKKIIDTQQEYAKQELVDNELNLRQTIEEALRIQSKKFTQAGVKIKNEYTDIPYIRGQKSSVIQILLNIFENACTAMQQNEPWNRIITIMTGIRNENNVFIKISDNGIGIRKEDLEKIFTFGFTNREDGHGFGLHACADIINKMGGTITAGSSGPGKGASFTLHFPIKKI